jgi:hypothetical protein
MAVPAGLAVKIAAEAAEKAANDENIMSLLIGLALLPIIALTLIAAAFEGIAESESGIYATLAADDAESVAEEWENLKDKIKEAGVLENAYLPEALANYQCIVVEENIAKLGLAASIPGFSPWKKDDEEVEKHLVKLFERVGTDEAFSQSNFSAFLFFVEGNGVLEELLIIDKDYRDKVQTKIEETLEKAEIPKEEWYLQTTADQIGNIVKTVILPPMAQLMTS